MVIPRRTLPAALTSGAIPKSASGSRLVRLLPVPLAVLRPRVVLGPVAAVIDPLLNSEVLDTLLSALVLSRLGEPALVMEVLRSR